MRTTRFAPLAFAVGSVISGLLAVFFGAVPLTGVEPEGLSFVGCGPAVFGRPSPVPNPECSSAYNALPVPLVALTWLLVAAGAAMLLVALALLLNRSKAPTGTV